MDWGPWAAERVNALGYPLRAAFDMHEEGMALLRQRLRRENPDASPDDIELLVAAWLADRPYESPGPRALNASLLECVDRAARVLEEEGRRCALVRGPAVSTRAEPRYTSGGILRHQQVRMTRSAVTGVCRAAMGSVAASSGVHRPGLSRPTNLQRANLQRV